MARTKRLNGEGAVRKPGEPELKTTYEILISWPDISGAPGLAGIPDVIGTVTRGIDHKNFWPYRDGEEATLILEDGREAEILFHGGAGEFVVNKLPGIERE